jgi:DNA invertase Pin-like site-specific DNA recombinase
MTKYVEIAADDSLRRLWELFEAGLDWEQAREDERKAASVCYQAIRQAHAQGASERRIAEVTGVDRMTVRRALGKL